MEGKLYIAVFLILCLTWHVQAQVNCTVTGAGRFANPSDTTCKNYTLCVASTTAGQYLSYNYVCPTTSLFNPTTSLCTTNYVCNVTTTNTTTSVCTADGFIADPDSTNCSTYIQCLDDGNGTFTEYQLTCPDGTLYDPDTTLCDASYNCTTTFTCTATGRYSDPATSTTCKNYYLCVLATNGTFVEYLYTCPSTSVFNPTTRLCTTSYTCPT